MPRVETWSGGPRGPHFGAAYNSHSGIRESGQRAAVPNIRTFGRMPAVERRVPERTQVPERPNGGRGASPATAPRAGTAHQGNDLYAGPRGDVYRRSPSGNWEQRTGTAWQPAAAAARPQLGHEAHARALGAQRAQDFRAMGGGMRGGTRASR